jgi:hypothetical protein
MAKPDDTKDDPAKGKPDDKKPDPGDLGDAGKKAIDDERKARRDAERQLKEMGDKLKALEDKDKSETERLTEKVTQLEKDLASATARADRYEVALEKGLDMTRAKRLTGSTREELEADADELSTWNAGAGNDGKPAAPPGKPAPDLKGGGDPTEEPAVDVRKVVADIPRGL